MVSGRTAFIGFSLLAHAAMAFGIDSIEVKKSHAATSIEIAEAKKPPKKAPPPPAKIDPPRKPEPPTRERRAAAPAPAEAPPPEAPPPSTAPIADLPDFGLSLTGGVDGTGIALPTGGSARGGPARPTAPVKSAPRKLAANADGVGSAADPCEDPPAKPKPRSVPQPLGTEAARAAGVEGKVRVQLTVDETGHVVDVKLLQGLGYGLDEAALAAARRAEFEPAVRCGKPTRATFNISMRFTL